MASLLVCLPLSAKDVKIEGKTFPPVRQVDGKDVQLSGVGTARYKVFFKIYVAGLYLPKDVGFDKVFTAVPKRLELCYLYDIEKADMVDAADNFLKKNVDAERYQAMQAKVAEINKLFRSVKKGERCSMNHVPGKGLEVDYNGKVVGSVAGDDFAVDYLRIWLGDESCSPGMRKNMMKGL